MRSPTTSGDETLCPVRRVCQRMFLVWASNGMTAVMPTPKCHSDGHSSYCPCFCEAILHSRRFQPLLSVATLPPEG